MDEFLEDIELVEGQHYGSEEDDGLYELLNIVVD